MPAWWRLASIADVEPDEDEQTVYDAGSETELEVT